MSSTATEKGGLVPGSKHVEQFGPDEDYEEDDGAREEEFYVTLDLGSVDHTLVPSSSSYRLIGLDTENPFLQLSGTIMRGYHQSLIGTELIFKDVTEDEEENEGEGDTPRNTNTNTNTNSTNVRYSTKTSRRIVFREVELKKPKTVVSGTGDAPRTSPNKDKDKDKDKDKENKKRHVDISSLCFGSPSGDEQAGETSSGGADPAVVVEDAAPDTTTTTTTTAG